MNKYFPKPKIQLDPNLTTRSKTSTTRSGLKYQGKGVLTEKQEANHLKKIILGEIKAGNTHPQLKIHLKTINKILKK